MKTVWVYVDTSKQVGDRDHLKVFANRDAADAWFAKQDPEGVAFEYDVLDEPISPSGKHPARLGNATSGAAIIHFDTAFAF